MLKAKDWEKAPDEASRNQLFMMFVKGKLKKLESMINVQDSIMDLQDDVIEDLEKLITGARKRIYTLEKKHLPKKLEPKVKKEQPWWLQLVTKKYK